MNFNVRSQDTDPANPADAQRRAAPQTVAPDLPAWDPASGKVRKRRRWPWILLALVIVVGGVYLFVVQPMLSPPATDAADPASDGPASLILTQFEVATVEPQTLESLIRVTGTIRPGRQTILSARVSETIDEITVEPGQAVATGDVLLRFDTTELQDNLAQLQTSLASSRVQLETAQATLVRTQTLADRNVATQATLDTAAASVSQAEASVAQLDAQVRAAERTLQNATVVAPYDGIIAEKNVAEGETVAAGSPLFTVVDLSVLQVEAMVPTSEVPRVQPGQSAALTIPGFSDTTFTATVERINPVAPGGVHALPVYLTLPNPDGILRGGMFTSGTILVETKADAIALPQSAIRSDDDGSFVLKVVDGELVRQVVTAGQSWNQGASIEIADGLASGDVVVTAPLPGLEAGIAVTVEGV